ncbi:MAG: hypothetical protein U9Q91_06025 [Candidatus Marinimicrobia bacterium]|nr:hypothetical protein [Candidatus Neomarinimicrobiota bacterium]
MKIWNFVLNCLIVGALAFLAGMLVSFLFNVIFNGSAMVAWGTTLRIAAVLGLVIPLAELLKIKSE